MCRTGVLNKVCAVCRSSKRFFLCVMRFCSCITNMAVVMVVPQTTDCAQTKNWAVYCILTSAQIRHAYKTVVAC